MQAQAALLPGDMYLGSADVAVQEVQVQRGLSLPHNGWEANFKGGDRDPQEHALGGVQTWAWVFEVSYRSTIPPTPKDATERHWSEKLMNIDHFFSRPDKTSKSPQNATPRDCLCCMQGAGETNGSLAITALKEDVFLWDK